MSCPLARLPYALLNVYNPTSKFQTSEQVRTFCFSFGPPRSLVGFTMPEAFSHTDRFKRLGGDWLLNEVTPYLGGTAQGPYGTSLHLSFL